MRNFKTAMMFGFATLSAGSLLAFQNCSATPGATGGSTSALSSASSLGVGCYLDGSTLVANGTVESSAFTVSSVPAGSVCPAATALTCTNGIWTGGGGAFSTCTVASDSGSTTVGSCSFDGSTIASGTSVTAYPSATDATCSASEQVTCTNGALTTADGTSYSLYPSLTCTTTASSTVSTGSYQYIGFTGTQAYSDPGASYGMAYCGSESPTTCTTVGQTCFIYSGWWWNDDAGQNEYNTFSCQAAGTSAPSIFGAH